MRNVKETKALIENANSILDSLGVKIAVNQTSAFLLDDYAEYLVGYQRGDINVSTYYVEILIAGVSTQLIKSKSLGIPFIQMTAECLPVIVCTTDKNNPYVPLPDVVLTQLNFVIKVNDDNTLDPKVEGWVIVENSETSWVVPILFLH
jgi:hypothetical protein